jgi:VCBS repeat-containing protein
MAATLSMTSIRRAALVVALTLTFAAAASAETLLMPKRDGTKGQQLVVWGVTTQANGTAFTIDFGDGTSTSGNVIDRSYIAFTKTYTALLPGEVTRTFTVTLTVGGDMTTTEVRIVDPTLLPGGVTGEGARGLKINQAIEDGLRWLWTMQSSRATNFPAATTTFWNQNTAWPQQWTALIALAFQNHGYRLPSNGSAPTGLYEKYIVRRALNYVITNLAAIPVSVQTANAGLNPPQVARDPCVGLSSDLCTALRSSSTDPGYGTGIAMLPLAASGALSKVNTEVAGYTNGKTYKEILQRMANALAFAQTDTGNGRGGWGYNLNNGNFDGSTVGWALLGLMDAEAAGVVVPSWVKTEFAVGLTNALNNNGSLDYQGDANPASAPNANLEKAGVGLQGMFFIGEIQSARANLTKTYISDRWNSGRIGGDYTGWGCGAIPNRGCGYAMFNNFKGLKLQGYITLPGVTRGAGPGAIPAQDWYADYQDWLVANQTSPTSTTGGNWGSMLFGPITSSTDAAAGMAELILSPVALVLPDADKFATVGLSPATDSAFELTSHTVTAHAQSASTPENPSGTPVAGATVNFTVLSGPNTGVTGSAITNSAGDAQFTYTDAGPVGTFGQDRIRANIGALLSNIAEMNWISLNRAPVANDNSYTTPEDSPLTGNVITDSPADTDADGDALTAILVTSPTHGVLALAPSGVFSYTPNPNYYGSDSFSYKLNDGEVDGNVAIVSITVASVNDAPIAGDGSATTDEDAFVGGQLTSSDIDGGAPKYAVSTGPAHGTLVVDENTGTYSYTPATNYNGPDSFTFSVSDGNGGADTGDVNITVTPVNDPPVAADGSATTDEDAAVTGSVSSTDIDGGAPKYAVSTGPAHGTLVLDENTGTFIYTPAANYNGPDSFTFSVSDGNGGADTGDVNITVTPVNDSPVANDGSEATPEDTPLAGTASSSDIDGPEAAYTVATGPAHGVVTLNPNGTYSYTPNENYNGPDSFTFTVNDGNGGSDTGQVSINVTPVNDPPFCAAAAPSLGEAWPPNHQLVDINVLGVTDPVEGSAITITVTDIWQDEPTNTQGDGNTPIDGYGVGTSTASIRAERTGNKNVPGDGRMYHILFTGTDAQGGTCTGDVKVTVPHDQGGGNTVTDGGLLYKSTGQ